MKEKYVIRYCALTLLSFSLLGVSSLAQADTPMLPGSFLRHHVNSVRELVSEVDSDSIVTKRYEQHFHMSKADIEISMATLRYGKLKKSALMPVWYDHPGIHGDVQNFRLRTVEAGSYVFFAPNGTPVLIGICGNAIGKIPLPPPPRTAMSNDLSVAYSSADTSLPPASQQPNLLPSDSRVALADYSSPDAGLLAPPGLSDSHLPGGASFPYEALAAPLFFIGKGTSHTPTLGGPPTQQQGSGGQTPFGVPAPEANSLSILTVMGCVIWLTGKRKIGCKTNLS